MRSIVSAKSTFLYRNFPDFIAPAIRKHTPDGRLKIVYAGLLGIAQGIYKLCQEFDCPDTELHIYGSGAEQIRIEEFIAQHPELPIFYHGHVSRVELHSQLLNYNIAIIPLLNRIYGSVPSKIFEYARLGLPMVYFGGGEGEGIINRLDLGWVAKAGDYRDLNHVLSTIDRVELSEVRRKKIQDTALVHFDFNKQLTDLIALL